MDEWKDYSGIIKHPLKEHFLLLYIRYAFYLMLNDLFEQGQRHRKAR